MEKELGRFMAQEAKGEQLLNSIRNQMLQDENFDFIRAFAYFDI
jgi:hypothetical protein